MEIRRYWRWTKMRWKKDEETFNEGFKRKNFVESNRE